MEDIAYGSANLDRRHLALRIAIHRVAAAIGHFARVTRESRGVIRLDLYREHTLKTPLVQNLVIDHRTDQLKVTINNAEERSKEFIDALPSQLAGTKMTISSVNVAVGGHSKQPRTKGSQDEDVSAQGGGTELTPLQKQIIAVVKELRKEYTYPTDELVATKIGSNRRGQQYTRETINRERKKMRNLKIDV